MGRRATVKQPCGLLEFLLETWPETRRKQVRNWLKFQSVCVNGRSVSQFDHPLRPGDEITIQTNPYAVPQGTLRYGMTVHFEDPHILVIDKPSGLLSIASDGQRERTAYYQLTEYVRGQDTRSRGRVWIVHRLDRDTSGLMVFAKTRTSKEILQETWHEFDKYYEAVVEGRLPVDEGTFASHLNETNPHHVFSAPESENTRHAITHFRLLALGASYSLVALRLDTGRRHQIRVHLAESGFPVVGDRKYNATTNPLRRLALHSSELELRHPITREWMRFRSPAPREFARLID